MRGSSSRRRPERTQWFVELAAAFRDSFRGSEWTNVIQAGERLLFSAFTCSTRAIRALDHVTRAFAQWADVVSVEHDADRRRSERPGNTVSRIRVNFKHRRN